MKKYLLIAMLKSLYDEVEKYSYNKDTLSQIEEILEVVESIKEQKPLSEEEQ